MYSICSFSSLVKSNGTTSSFRIFLVNKMVKLVCELWVAWIKQNQSWFLYSLSYIFSRKHTTDTCQLVRCCNFSFPANSSSNFHFVSITFCFVVSLSMTMSGRKPKRFSFLCSSIKKYDLS